MEILAYLIPVSLILGGIGLAAFIEGNLDRFGMYVREGESCWLLSAFLVVGPVSAF